MSRSAASTAIWPTPAAATCKPTATRTLQCSTPYEQEYKDKSYTLFTDDLNTEYRLFNQLQNEYDTVAAYTDFLDGVQTKATQLAGISIFQNDKTGYDLKNIEQTAEVYAGLGATEIDYYPKRDWPRRSPTPLLT